MVKTHGFPVDFPQQNQSIDYGVVLDGFGHHL